MAVSRKIFHAPARHSRRTLDRGAIGRFRTSMPRAVASRLAGGRSSSMRELQCYDVFETARGFVAIAWDANGITSLRLPVGSSAAAEHALLKRVARAVRAKPSAEIAAIIDAAKRYFIGEHVDFSGVAVDLGRAGSVLRERLRSRSRRSAGARRRRTARSRRRSAQDPKRRATSGRRWRRIRCR